MLRVGCPRTVRAREEGVQKGEASGDELLLTRDKNC